MFGTSCHIECFEMSRKSAQTPLYYNFWVRYSSFSKSNNNDPTQIKIWEKNFIHLYFPIHNQFCWFALSQDVSPHSQCRIPFFQPILPWLSFWIWPKEDYWKICGLPWLPRLMWINDQRDASRGLETTKNCKGGIWRVRWMRWQFGISVFEVFLHQSCSMRTRIILVQDRPFSTQCFQLTCCQSIFKTSR